MATVTPFFVTIANVEGTLFSGEIEALSVPSVEGVITILAHHAPLITLLKKGTVRVTENVKSDASANVFEISSGVLEVSNNRAIVLV